MNVANTNANGEYAILYVDDEEMALKYFERSLRRDYTVHTAVSADAGLDVLEKHGDHGIGVLITDQRMPGLSGVDLLKQVRKRWPHIVRLLTTAYADLDEAIDAVNRGEIFRYITKPWDIKVLHTEVAQAMGVFRLQHEHAALLREKMSVWQRLIQLGRLRDLVVMGGSLSHLRHGENAVAAYLRDHLAAHTGQELASAQYLDLWRLTEAEISKTLAFVGEIRERLASMSGGAQGFDTRVTPDRLLRLGDDAFAITGVVDGTRPPDICMAAQAADLLFAELARAGGETDGEIRLRAAMNNSAVSLSLPAAAAANADLTARAAAGLLTAYLIAFHHGGSLALDTAGPRRRYLLTLPVEPAAVCLAPPTDGWLDPLLVRLEGWD